MSSSQVSQNMTYAQALNDAKALIVQQSTRIKSDAQKIRQQADEIAHLKTLVEAMSYDLERLRTLEPQLAEAQDAREHAEAAVGRQRMEIESLEYASRELHRIVGEQGARISELTAEVEHLRGSLPTHEDEAALEAMNNLLSLARKKRQHAPQPPPELIGPKLVRDEPRQVEAMVIPAEPTPFCQIARRKAA